MINLFDQLMYASEGAATDGALGDDSEPAFDLIDPGAISWSVMDLVARPHRQPALDLGMLVSGVVVHDQMEVEFGRDVLIEVAKELEKLLMAVAGLALADHLAGGDLERREEGGGAVADVIMGDALDITQPHGEQRLGAIQGLNLAFFIHAQHQRVLGRVQIEADDVSDFFDKEGIVGELEVALAMGLKAEGVPDSLDGGLGKTGGVSEGAATPMGAVFGLGLEGGLNGEGNFFIGDGTRPSGPKFIMQSLETLFEKAFSPFADRTDGEVNLLGNGAVGLSVGGREHNFSARDQTMWE